MNPEKDNESLHTLQKNQKDALMELKLLLEKLKPEITSNDQRFISSLHSQMVDEFCATPNSKTKKLLTNSNNQDICSYLSSIAKSSLPSLFSFLSDTKEEETDNASIYESEPGETKTIYRSTSFDNDENDTMYFNQCDTSSQNEESHGFNLDNFSDTFNLSESDEKKEAGMSSPLTYKNITANSSNNALNIQNAELSESYPSIGSDGSVQFDDVFAKDILGDLDDLAKVKDKTSNDQLNEDIVSVKSINSQSNKIVDSIVSKLRKQLQPTLDKLSRDSQKYEIMKTIYKLPSISNINDGVKLKYNFSPQKFKLDFDNDMIHEMVRNEIIETENKTNKTSQFTTITAEEQVKLNFNKFRQLHTIVEEESIDKKSINYAWIQDIKKIKELETEELINLLQNVKSGELEDIGRVKRLVNVFESQQETSVNKLDNKALKEAILTELNKRHII